jgi:hypothetical protein
MRLLSILFILVSYQVVGQDTLTYNDILSNKYKKLKNYSEFKYYKDKNGFIFRKGDKLKILNPANPNNISQDLFGKNLYGNFSYLLKQKGLILTVEKTFSGEEIEIDNIYIFNMPFIKKLPIEIYLECKLNRVIDGLNKIQISNIDKALEQSEVEIIGLITRDKALEMLRKHKELLDLKLISQKEFDLKREELGKIILDNRN